LEWPARADELLTVQEELGRGSPPAWTLPEGGASVGGCFVCFPRGVSGPGAAGDPGWAAATVLPGGRADVQGRAGAPYARGLLALREGPLLEAAVRALDDWPDVLLVDATGKDHPRRAGLALHLGAVLDVPTVGVTHRPLLAAGDWPADERGAVSPLALEGEIVGFWVRARAGRRPLAVHAAWRTDPETAVACVVATLRRARTPEPLRQARRLARTARAQSSTPP
jgi:deoxyribonuclease V